jgi:hypothetical protein
MDGESVKKRDGDCQGRDGRERKGNRDMLVVAIALTQEGTARGGGGGWGGKGEGDKGGEF